MRAGRRTGRVNAQGRDPALSSAPCPRNLRRRRKPPKPGIVWGVAHIRASRPAEGYTNHETSKHVHAPCPVEQAGQNLRSPHVAEKEIVRILCTEVARPEHGAVLARLPTTSDSGDSWWLQVSVLNKKHGQAVVTRSVAGFDEPAGLAGKRLGVRTLRLLRKDPAPRGHRRSRLRRLTRATAGPTLSPWLLQRKKRRTPSTRTFLARGASRH